MHRGLGAGVDLEVVDQRADHAGHVVERLERRRGCAPASSAAASVSARACHRAASASALRAARRRRRRGVGRRADHGVARRDGRRRASRATPALMRACVAPSSSCSAASASTRALDLLEARGDPVELGVDAGQRLASGLEVAASHAQVVGVARPASRSSANARVRGGEVVLGALDRGALLGEPVALARPARRAGGAPRPLRRRASRPRLRRRPPPARAQARAPSRRAARRSRDTRSRSASIRVEHVGDVVVPGDGERAARRRAPRRRGRAAGPAPRPRAGRELGAAGRAGARRVACSRRSRGRRGAARIARSSSTRPSWRRAASAWRSSGASWRRTSRSRSVRRRRLPSVASSRRSAFSRALAELQDARRLPR